MKSTVLFTTARIAAGNLILFGLFTLVGQTTFASAILPGFDLFSTPPGGAIFNPSNYGLGPNVNIPMVGRPIGPGNTDTIVQRFGGLPAGGTGIIPAELVSLSLESIAPVPLGSSFFDVFVDLNPSIQSTGNLNITIHLDPTGGTFDSFFDVFARVTLTEVGNPSNQQQFQVHDTISSGGSPWSHFAPPAYPNVSQYPAGGFYPGAVGGAPGIPSQPVGVTHTGPHPYVVPATPEPSSLMLIGMALASLSVTGRRRTR